MIPNTHPPSLILKLDSLGVLWRIHSLSSRIPVGCCPYSLSLESFTIGYLASSVGRQFPWSGCLFPHKNNFLSSDSVLLLYLKNKDGSYLSLGWGIGVYACVQWQIWQPCWPCLVGYWRVPGYDISGPTKSQLIRGPCKTSLEKPTHIRIGPYDILWGWGVAPWRVSSAVLRIPITPTCRTILVT